MIRIAVIGYGGRIRGLCANYFPVFDFEVKVTAIADRRAAEIREQAERDFPGVRVYDKPAEMLERETFDGIMIGTNCDTHAEFACLAAPRGVPIFLEKPVGTTLEQLRCLKAIVEASGVPVVVSFPLRYTTLGQNLKEVVDSGAIGTVEHVQYLNNVNYGDVYFYAWYRDHDIIGGLFLQKAVHDFHLMNFLLDEHPSQVAAMNSRRVYGGDKDHDLECHTCDEREECPESSRNLYFMRAEGQKIGAGTRRCVFSNGHKNEDNGSALLQYPSGRQAVYSQNFFARKSAITRGGVLVGYKGTIEFDFYTSEIKVIYHHRPRVDTINVSQSAGSHLGGDLNMLLHYFDILRGKSPTTGSPIREGIASALTALKARESAESRTFREIDYDNF
ncbi:MAG: Gfo/Idh/MocA family oxidoreductase [bacterium]|nr:Gfo/Idh/MocA family oxidoreductase [bacterium]